MSKAAYQAVVTAIKAKDPAITKEIYQEAFPKCARYILDNSGQYEQAQDVFQEAFVVLFQKCQDPDFELTASPSTYLYAVVQRMWLMYLRKRKRQGGAKIEISEIAERFLFEDDEGIAQKKELERQINAVARVFDQLKPDCRKMLSDYYYKKIPLKAIAKAMGYKYNFAKVKKNRCMNYLRKLVAQLKQ